MKPAGIALRGVEAFIDLVVCYAVLYAVAAATGSTTDQGGFRLAGAPFIIGVGACLTYYIVLEAVLGATLGKLATNLRVVRQEDGGPIGWSASVVRNVLRLIDGVVFYVIGFITACVSKKHQRLGDLVAGTIVVRRSIQVQSIAGGSS
jgi:uncharacterized RDD family membrane protein YckC